VVLKAVPPVNATISAGSQVVENAACLLNEWTYFAPLLLHSEARRFSHFGPGRMRPRAVRRIDALRDYLQRPALNAALEQYVKVLNRAGCHPGDLDDEWGEVQAGHRGRWPAPALLPETRIEPHCRTISNISASSALVFVSRLPSTLFRP
jgi:hypothetical protein